MEYIDAYLVVCVNVNPTYSSKWQEVNIKTDIYCPHGAFIKKSDAVEYAKIRPEKTLIVPCSVPKVVNDAD